MRVSSTGKIFEGLRLRLLKIKILVQKNEFFYKLFKSESPPYLFNTIPNSNTQCQMRNSGNIPSFFIKHDYLF